MAKKKQIKTAVELMEEGLSTYEERNAEYGNSYHIHGEIMNALFPEGVDINDPDSFKRFGIVNGIVGKLNRYCRNFESGGHLDSAHDLGVMGFILEELSQ